MSGGLSEYSGSSAAFFGTTALVANQLGRNAVLIELNPAYADIARRRLKGMQGCLI